MKHCLRLRHINFKAEVLGSNIPVLVDFWSSWCPPCKMNEPVINELAEELEGKIKVCEINIDQNPGIGQEYNISGVPTFILFKEGKILKRAAGAHSKKQLLELIKE